MKELICKKQTTKYQSSVIKQIKTMKTERWQNMKLALIQTKQNELYNFPGTRTFDTEEVLQLRHEYMEEVFRMAEEAAKGGADLLQQK